MTTPCIHFWVLDKYNHGTCKLCGVTKQCGPDPRETMEVPRYGRKAGRFVEMDKPIEEMVTTPVDGKVKLAAALDMVKANPEMSVTQIALKNGIPVSTLAYQVKIKELRPRDPGKTKIKHKVRRRRPLRAKERNEINAYIRQNPEESFLSVAARFNRSKTAIHGICKQAGIERKKKPRSRTVTTIPGASFVPAAIDISRDYTWYIETTEKELRAVEEEIAIMEARLAIQKPYAEALGIILEVAKRKEKA